MYRKTTKNSRVANFGHYAKKRKLKNEDREIEDKENASERSSGHGILI